jgi:hypothetical protein
VLRRFPQQTGRIAGGVYGLENGGLDEKPSEGAFIGPAEEGGQQFRGGLVFRIAYVVLPDEQSQFALVQQA